MRVVVVEHVNYVVTGYDRDLMPIAERGISDIEVFGNWEKAENYILRNLKRRYEYPITEYYTIDHMGRDQKVYSNEQYNMEELKLDQFDQYIVSDLEVE